MPMAFGGVRLLLNGTKLLFVGAELLLCWGKAVIRVARLLFKLGSVICLLG